MGVTKMMQCNRFTLGTVAGLLTCAFSALAQDPASLERYLLNRFPTTKFEKSKIVKPGIVLTVQQSGIGSLAPNGGVAMGRSAVMDLAFPNSYKNGAIHHDGKAVFLTNAGTSRDLAVGERVYLLKIDVKDSAIVFNVQTCGNCDPNLPDPENLPARANVTFQFGKAYLSTATPAQVEEIITHVFAPDQANATPNQSGSNQSAPPPAAAQPGTPMAPIPPPPPPDSPAASPAAPAEIKIGQTTDQVTAALGQPLQIFNLGPKVVYKYKSLKVTFVNGKVSDVE